MKVRIYVMPRKEVLDPQGKAIMSSLSTLGFSNLQEVRQGKLLELTLAEQNTDKIADIVHEMCKKLLVNEIIEDYNFEIVQNT
ncbi:phosphoribosylformylglycinamidine synthase [Rickettsiales bacterium Ac37b]|nr:phosphoribosylformylglycinamidine synthase [Rickettsiales bacterium Ac37b]